MTPGSLGAATTDRADVRCGESCSGSPLIARVCVSTSAGGGKGTAGGEVKKKE